MLQDRKLLVTGGASGIGEALVALALEAGARVHVLDLQPPRQAAEGLSASAADVRDAEAVRAAVEAARAAMGGIDGVANVAGINARAGELGQTDFGLWRKVLEVNLLGALHTAEFALPALRASASASIVNVASGVGLRPFPGVGAYAASKGGLIALTRTWAMELGPGVRVNAVCPGPVDTPLLAGRAEREGGLVARIDPSSYALQRIAQAGEVAAAIAFLLGADASYITGATLAVDGGRTFH
ncbi:SDR family NAD(P)-dependent oxidoreductase [Pseudorhodoferax sp.]|uniref:SDR family NAD(P)-dependent oxidoreductase n=1 Tax=Pseudorhodoferax sp. TaxID=1993553 RepID=UPI002DD63E72|nr:SDR family oxidoreductase [Pseudorhodoferax sp.]